MNVALTHQRPGKSTDQRTRKAVTRVPAPSLRPVAMPMAFRCACGGGCPRCKGETVLSGRGLKVSEPNDKYEKEADRVADQVMGMPNRPGPPAGGHALKRSIASAQLLPHEDEEQRIRRQPAATDYAVAILQAEGEADLAAMLQAGGGDGSAGILQAKATSDHTPQVTPGLEAQVQSMRGRGQPLSESVRAFFEPRFGYDFGDVRIHTDAQAAESARLLNADAFALGNDLMFAAGQYDPHSATGQWLLAHELTHVVQQSSAARHFENAQTFTISRQIGPNQLFRHTIADCEQQYETCCDGCRRLPNKTKTDKARRALCWSQCMSAYAGCLASAEETLTFAAIVALIIIASLAAPVLLTAGAAAALLIGLGITSSSKGGTDEA